MRTQDPKLQQSAQFILQGDAEGLFSSVKVTESFDDIVDLLYTMIQPKISPRKIDPAVFLREANSFRVLNALRQGLHSLEEINQKLSFDVGSPEKANPKIRDALLFRMGSLFEKLD